MISNGYGNLNGMSSSNLMSSAFDSNVDHATSVLDLVNGSSSLMMNGHGPSFDPGHSNYYSSHNGKTRILFFIRLYTSWSKSRRKYCY